MIGSASWFCIPTTYISALIRINKIQILCVTNWSANPSCNYLVVWQLYPKNGKETQQGYWGEWSRISSGGASPDRRAAEGHIREGNQKHIQRDVLPGQPPPHITQADSEGAPLHHHSLHLPGLPLGPGLHPPQPQGWRHRRPHHRQPLHPAGHRLRQARRLAPHLWPL